MAQQIKAGWSDLDAYCAILEKLGGNVENIMKAALYEGADVIADAVRAEIEALPVKKGTGFTQKVKDGLLQGMGLSPMKTTEDGVDIKLGFDGYYGDPTKKYPKGFPIPFQARILIKGTSNTVKNDFVGRAVRKKKKKAVEAINVKIDEEVAKQIWGNEFDPEGLLPF